MVRIPAHQIGLAAAVLFLAVAHAIPSEPLHSSTSSSSYGVHGTNTPLTSFASSTNNNASGSAYTTEEPPFVHHSDDTSSRFGEPGIGPPEDSDSSQPPNKKSIKGTRRRKRQASTHSSDLRPIQEYLQQYQIEPSGQPIIEDNIDPRLLDRGGTNSTGYPYESKSGSAYTIGDKAGIASQTFAQQASETPKRHRAPRKTDFYKCAEVVDGKVCGRSHDTQAQLNHHMKNHGPKRFFCSHDRCSSAFAVRDQLAKHERTVHATEHQYICYHCETSTNRRDVMVKHETTKKHRARVAAIVIQNGPTAEHTALT